MMKYALFATFLVVMLRFGIGYVMYANHHNPPRLIAVNEQACMGYERMRAADLVAECGSGEHAQACHREVKQLVCSWHFVLREKGTNNFDKMCDDEPKSIAETNACIAAGWKPREQ